MREINIPYGVTSIKEGTFAICGYLKKVLIPSSVTSIEDFAFDYCDSLKDVYYGGSNIEWEKIKIKNYNDVLITANIHYGTYEYALPQNISGTVNFASCKESADVTSNRSANFTYDDNYFKIP